MSLSTLVCRVKAALVSLACNRQSSETTLTFLEGVINMEVLGLNYRRLGKTLLLIQPRSQQEGDRGNEVASYWRYVLMHVHAFKSNSRFTSSQGSDSSYI